MKKAIVHWRNTETGSNGHGEPIDLDAAKAHVDQANRTLTFIHHWFVEEKST